MAPGPNTRNTSIALAGADLELGQIGDELPHPEHPLELLLDAVGLVRRDAGDGGQLGRVVRNDLQCLCPELIEDLRRPCALRCRAASRLARKA